MALRLRDRLRCRLGRLTLEMIERIIADAVMVNLTLWNKPPLQSMRRNIGVCTCNGVVVNYVQSQRVRDSRRS